MAAQPNQAQKWSTKRIAAWLRQYPEWAAELEALREAPPSASTTDFSRPVVMGGRGGESGGAPLARAARLDELERRVETVNQWLSGMSGLERQVVQHYTDEDCDATEVALQTGLAWPVAKAMCRALPAIILGRHYDPKERSTNTIDEKTKSR